MYPDYLVHFNPNHDPKTGQFAPGAGGSTVNKVGARLKKADLLNVDGPNAWRDFKNKTGNYSRLKAAADTGMKAMAKCGDKEPLEEDWGDWFLFEDQTFGMPQIADLANKGKTKDEIKQIIKDCQEYSKNDYLTDLPGVWPLDEWANSNQYYTVDGDKYIDACIEVAKENRQLKQSGITEFGNYLCHFNPNHDPKTGQFAPATGSFKGVRVLNPNKKAVKEGMFTKDGYFTQKAEKSLDKVTEYQKKKKATDEAGEKLIKSDKRLIEGFGGSYKNVDDPSFLWMVADSYGIKGAKEFLDTVNDELVYLKNNKEDIQRGIRWANTYTHSKLPNIRMDFY